MDGMFRKEVLPYSIEKTEDGMYCIISANGTNMCTTDTQAKATAIKIALNEFVESCIFD